jgi:hypothetical protein
VYRYSLDYVASFGLVNKDTGAAVAAGPKLATDERDDVLKAMHAKEIAALVTKFRAVGAGWGAVPVV